MSTLTCPIAYWAKLCPTLPALIEKNRSFSYLELHTEISHLSYHLQKILPDTTSPIAFLAHPSREAIVLLFALWRLQKIACPLSPKTPPFTLTSLPKTLGDHLFLNLANLEYPQNYPIAKEHPLKKEQLATLLFTSGSSATPKLAAHTIGNHYYSALGALSALSLKQHHCWLLSLPLSHVGGLAILWRCFLQGASLALSPLPLQSSLLELPITHLSVVPTQLYRLVQDPLPEHAPLSCILVGGAPCPPLLYKEASKLYPGKIHLSYGLTEMSSLVTLSSSQASQELHYGTRLTYRDLYINSQGEIHVKGKTLFQGYWDSSQKLHLPLTPEGWFATGDLGALSPKGNLLIHGRKDNLFISGGENIQPEEIEQTLMQFPGVLEAIVVPISDPEYGERPVVFLSQKDPSPSFIQNLRHTLKEFLPPYKLPLFFFPLPQDSPSLKRDRKALKQVAEAYLKQQVTPAESE